VTGDDPPLYTLKESSWSRADTQGRGSRILRVFKDRVEYVQPRLIAKGTSEVIRYEQIAQTRLHEHLVFAGIQIETNGGGGFRIDGLNKAQARAAKAAIDERIAALRDRVQQGSSGLSEELANLERLRQSGVLSEDEFVAAKQRLLSGD
jgi:Short C-terminal domain